MCDFFRIGRLISLFALLTTAGCVSAISVQKEEVKLYALKDTSTFEATLDYARELSEAYIRMSDRASAAQDVAALALIGVAAVAAGSVLYDANLDLIKGAGLAAGTLTASTAYFRPGETGTHLLGAAEQLLCIVKAGQLLPAPYRDNEAMDIARDGILTARLILRNRLRRTLPDYRSLVEALKSSAKQQAAMTLESTGGGEIYITEFRTSVVACLL